MTELDAQPPPLPARDAALAASVRIQRDAFAARSREPRALDLPPIETDPIGPHVGFVELLLDHEFAERDCSDDAEHRAIEVILFASLADSSLLPAIPEHMMIQIAFGESAGWRNARKMTRLLARARQRGVSADEYILEAATRGDLADDTSARLFRGETTRRPDDDRVRRGIKVVRRTLAHIDESDRPSLLCVAAWLHWIRGQGTVAMSYVVEALRIEPSHILAQGLASLITTKSPQWR